MSITSITKWTYNNSGAIFHGRETPSLAKLRGDHNILPTIPSVREKAFLHLEALATRPCPIRNVSLLRQVVFIVCLRLRKHLKRKETHAVHCGKTFVMFNTKLSSVVDKPECGPND